MASRIKDPGGKKRIQFVAPDGKRKTIRLGKMPLAQARNVKHKIESLLSSKASGQPLDNETAAWVRGIPDALSDKLAKAGLVAARGTMTVSNMLNNFMNSNSDAKPATLTAWNTVKRDLEKHLGDVCPIRTVGLAEAEGFRQWMIKRKLASTTVHRRLQFARQFFAHAVHFEGIDKNPFEGVKHKSGNPQKRQRYITPEDTEKLIEAAPNWEWRTIIALARYGGEALYPSDRW